MEVNNFLLDYRDVVSEVNNRPDYDVIIELE